MYVKTDNLSVMVFDCFEDGDVGCVCVMVSAWGCPIDSQCNTDVEWIVPGTIEED